MPLAVWWVRLIFAAWMIPAGLNHFVPLFPQPLGNMPLSTEVITALIDTGLFDIVKAVELLAGLCLLFNVRVPLALVIELPVSFNVWYWDTALQGWWSVSAIYGWAVLLCNLALIAAYWRAYAPLLSLRAPMRLGRSRNEARQALTSQQLGLLRLAFAVALLAGGANHFLGLVPYPQPGTAAAEQLLAAFLRSGLMGVAAALALAAGAMMLAGLATPLALAAVMPLSVCAAYWAVILNGAPGLAALALGMLGVNALLMLAHLPHYQAMLAPRFRAAGESETVHYGAFFAHRLRPAPRHGSLAALAAFSGAVVFYAAVVPFASGDYGLAVLALPAAMLLSGTIARLRVRGR